MVGGRIRGIMFVSFFGSTNSVLLSEGISLKLDSNQFTIVPLSLF